MALALNRTLTRIPGKRLDLVDYGDNETASVLKEELDRTSFIGITVSEHMEFLFAKHLLPHVS